MLFDTGSSSTLIDQELWEPIKNESGPLEDVKFNIRSASKHVVDVLGQADVTLSLFTKEGEEVKFPVKAMIVHGLLHKVILGIDFLTENKAEMNLEAGTVTLDRNANRTMYRLKPRKPVRSSTNVVLPQATTIAPRQVRRLECHVEGRPEPDTEVIFEAGEETELLVAASVDTVHDDHITVQVVNTTDRRICLPEGLIIGQVSLRAEDEIVEAGEENELALLEASEEVPEPWLQLIEVGDDTTPAEEKKRIVELIRQYSDVFSHHDGDYGRCDIIQHRIELEGRPKRCGVRPLNPTMRDELKRQLEDFRRNDFIQPSKSEFASPVVLVKKKDGGVRFCIDFRNLNTVTRKDAYPLPRISEVIDTLAQGRIFSTLDLKSGYHQIAMHPADQHKTAFITQHGLFEWKVMPMGLTNAPATFERLMELIMTGLTWESVLVYLDDVIVFGRDYAQHYERLERVFQRLRHANLKLSPKKCHIAKRRIVCLGHVVEDGRVLPDPEKTRLIETYRPPKDLKEVRSFVSLLSFYRRYIQKFAQIAKPLTNLLEKNAKFNWTEECQRAFDYLKNQLCTQAKLNLPDFNQPFRLACDASNVALGAVLSQLDENGREQPVAFASRVLSKAERNWSVTEREAYAIVWAIGYFRQYLLGRPFQLVSDHKPLVWLRSMKNPAPKLARWILQLEEYQFEIQYREGPQKREC